MSKCSVVPLLGIRLLPRTDIKAGSLPLTQLCAGWEFLRSVSSPDRLAAADPSLPPAEVSPLTH